MDLKVLQAKQDPIDVPVVFDADGKPESGFKVLGADSKQYQQVDREFTVSNVKKTARRGRGVDTSTDTGAAEVVAQHARREFEIAKACVVELYGFTKDGQPAELNDETLREIFDARPTWRRKVVAAIETEQLFTTS